MAQKTGTNEKGQPAAQSPELAGGAGFTFEDAVSALFLSALLGEGYAPGVENRTVCRVALQQRNFGEPLDDVIIDFRDTNGELARQRGPESCEEGRRYAAGSREGKCVFRYPVLH
ncbi:MAG: hypothetical protein WCS87_19770 [Methylococcaceae bacterium]